MNIRLIPDARLAWRFASVQAALLLTVLSAIQLEVLPVIQPLVPPDKWPYVSAGLSLLIIVLRVVPQPALETERALLGIDKADALPLSVHAGAGADEAAQAHVDDRVDARVEAMAMALYQATCPARAWTKVSPQSQYKWRLVAQAALQNNATLAQSVPTAAGTGGEHF